MVLPLLLPAATLGYALGRYSPAVRAPPPRAVLAADAVLGSSLTIVDKSGDEVFFVLGGTGPELQLSVNQELFADELELITYEKAERRVKVEGTLEDEDDGEVYEVDGDFILPEGPQEITMATLGILAARAGVEWVGNQPVDLPAELEAKLIDDELKASRPGVLLLWAQLLSVFPSEAEAKTAALKNSAIILPYLNRPNNIVGSWKVLLGMMGPEEALEVVTKNPGILASNPEGLKTSNKAAVQTMAAIVDGVEAVKWWGK